MRRFHSHLSPRSNKNEKADPFVKADRNRARNVRSANRAYYSPGRRSDGIGVRLLRIR